MIASWRLSAARIVAAIVVALLVTGTAARAAGNGVIDGTVVNGTAGGAAPVDLKVTIHSVRDRTQLDKQEVSTDGAGRFHVEGLETGANIVYLPIVEYAGVPYFPDRPVVLDGSGSAQVTIQVYETSPTPTDLTFDRANMLIMNVSPSALTVMEMGAVVNGSDRTFDADARVTGSDRTLRFNLPAGAIQVTPQTGLAPDGLESTPDGFATTDPVRPGRREIAYSYQLPYDSSTLDLTRSFTLPVGTFTLYLPDQGIDVIGPGLALQGTADLGGRTYRQYAVQNLRAGDELRFRLTNLPAPLLARPRDLGLAVATIGGLALAALLIVAIRRRTSDSAATVPTAEGAGSRDAERAELVRSLAELDERFAAGGVDEAEYRARREAEKARLLTLVAATPESS
jgi:hypothetical protein